MNRLGKQFLARPGFPHQQNVAVHMRIAACLMNRPLNGRAFAQNILKMIPGHMSAHAQAGAQIAFGIGNALRSLKRHQRSDPLPVVIHNHAVEHAVVSVDAQNFIGIALIPAEDGTQAPLRQDMPCRLPDAVRNLAAQ